MEQPKENKKNPASLWTTYKEDAKYLSEKAIEEGIGWNGQALMEVCKRAIKKYIAKVFIQMNGRDLDVLAVKIEGKFLDMNPDNREAVKEFKDFLHTAISEHSKERKAIWEQLL